MCYLLQYARAAEICLLNTPLDLSEVTTQSPSASCSSSTVTSNRETKQPSITYEEFRKRKEAKRVSTLPASMSSRNKKSKCSKSKGNTTEKVKIQVGIKEFSELDSSLKVLKGRTLPIAVNACIHAKGLLQEALSKHSKHFRSFNGNINEYVLLYPDNTVVNLLPGSPEFFSLKEYKEDLGKPYSKMSLHLCKLECLEKYEKESKSDDDLAECQGDVNFNLHGASECKMAPSVNESNTHSSILPFLNANTSADTVTNQSCEHRELKATYSECEMAPVVNESSTQSSILPFLNANTSTDTVANQSCERRELKATCPTGYLDFPICEIEVHADVCAEQFDPVGTVNVELESETPDDQDELVSEQVSTIRNDGSGMLGKIKDVIRNLHQLVDMENINRVSIRRRYAYQDYLDARARQKRRKRFHQNGMLKGHIHW